MTWTDLWFSLPEASRERALLLSVAWRAVSQSDDRALMSNTQGNVLDGYSLLNQLQWVGLPVPPDAMLIRPAVERFTSPGGPGGIVRIVPIQPEQLPAELPKENRPEGR